VCILVGVCFVCVVYHLEQLREMAVLCLLVIEVRDLNLINVFFFKTGLKIGLKPLICVNETQWDLRYIVGRLVKL
jgi:hypothetical protein